MTSPPKSYQAKFWLCAHGEVLLSSEITPELAEICGIHAGDGYLRNDGKRVELDISGHICEDRRYYDEQVVPLFSRVFKIKLSPRPFPARRTYGFVIRDRDIVRYFHEFLSFPFGKKTYVVRCPNVIIQSMDEGIYSSFLRGFFDTDGCLNFKKTYGTYKNMTFKRTHHTYPRITFSTVSKNLMMDLMEMLDFLDIKYRVYAIIPPKENEAPRFMAWIRGKKMLGKWIEKIGFKNPVQITRYKIWKIFGFCPPNITLNERVQILKAGKDRIKLGPVAQPGWSDRLRIL